MSFEIRAKKPLGLDLNGNRITTVKPGKGAASWNQSGEGIKNPIVAGLQITQIWDKNGLAHPINYLSDVGAFIGAHTGPEVRMLLAPVQPVGGGGYPGQPMNPVNVGGAQFMLPQQQPYPGQSAALVGQGGYVQQQQSPIIMINTNHMAPFIVTCNKPVGVDLVGNQITFVKPTGGAYLWNSSSMGQQHPIVAGCRILQIADAMGQLHPVVNPANIPYFIQNKAGPTVKMCLMPSPSTAFNYQQQMPMQQMQPMQQPYMQGLPPMQGIQPQPLPGQQMPQQMPMQGYPAQQPMQGYPAQQPMQGYPAQQPMQGYPAQQPMQTAGYAAPIQYPPLQPGSVAVQQPYFNPGQGPEGVEMQGMQQQQAPGGMEGMMMSSQPPLSPDAPVHSFPESGQTSEGVPQPVPYYPALYASGAGSSHNVSAGDEAPEIPPNYEQAVENWDAPACCDDASAPTMDEHAI